MAERIVVLNLNGQSGFRTALSIRKAGVFAEPISFPAPLDQIQGRRLDGIVITGDAALTSEKLNEAMSAVISLFSFNVPILAIGPGMEVMVAGMGGQTGSPLPVSSGRCTIIFQRHPLFLGLGGGHAIQTWTHTCIPRPPEGFRPIAITEKCPVAAIGDDVRRFYGLQFPLEGLPTHKGEQILGNFLKNICGLKCCRRMDDVLSELVQQIQIQAGDQPLICPLTCRLQDQIAVILAHKAIGNKLNCILLEHGLSGQSERRKLRSYFVDCLDIHVQEQDLSESILRELQDKASQDERKQAIIRLCQSGFSNAVKELNLENPLYLQSSYLDEGALLAGSTNESFEGYFATTNCSRTLAPLSSLLYGELEELADLMELPERLRLLEESESRSLCEFITGSVNKETIGLLRQCEILLEEVFQDVFPSHERLPIRCELLNCPSVSQDNPAQSAYFLILKGMDPVGYTKFDMDYPSTVTLLQRISQRVRSTLPSIVRVLFDITTEN